jgi:hypothetical protein
MSKIELSRVAVALDQVEISSLVYFFSHGSNCVRAVAGFFSTALSRGEGFLSRNRACGSDAESESFEVV